MFFSSSFCNLLLFLTRNTYDRPCKVLFQWYNYKVGWNIATFFLKYCNRCLQTFPSKVFFFFPQYFKGSVREAFIRKVFCFVFQIWSNKLAHFYINNTLHVIWQLLISILKSMKLFLQHLISLWKLLRLISTITDLYIKVIWGDFYNYWFLY